MGVFQQLAGGIGGLALHVLLGLGDTVSVTMEDMIHHGAAVARGTKRALVVIDMPFMSYQASVYDAVVNAGRLMKEARANAVKLEGGVEVADRIRAIVAAQIPSSRSSRLFASWFGMWKL